VTYAGCVDSQLRGRAWIAPPEVILQVNTEPAMRLRKRRLLFVSLGLMGSLVGFGIAYWAIWRFAPHASCYIFTTIGLLSTLYGFCWAFYANYRRRMPLRGAAPALALTSAGLIATLYAFYLACRGVLHATDGAVCILLMLLVSTGLGGALFGFSHASRQSWAGEGA
jgi:peptidoglycan/LPS O-acetylase OafA/YrhL